MTLGASKWVMSWGALCYSVNWVLFWENTRLNLFELGRGTQDLREGGSKFKKKKTIHRNQDIQ